MWLGDLRGGRKWRNRTLCVLLSWGTKDGMIITDFRGKAFATEVGVSNYSLWSFKTLKHCHPTNIHPRIKA